MAKSISSKFYCLNCGGETFLPRKLSKMREKWHLKSIYCFRCQEDYNHLEVREFDLDFDKERFLEDLAEGKFKEDAIPPKRREKGESV